MSTSAPLAKANDLVPAVTRRPRRVLAASGWIALAATALPAGGFPRMAAVGLFLFFAPGFALLLHWKGRDPLGRFVLGVALSATMAMLVAEGQALAGLWDPRLSLAILAAITSVAALVPPGGMTRPARS